MKKQLKAYNFFVDTFLTLMSTEFIFSNKNITMEGKTINDLSAEDSADSQNEFDRIST
jgi:hypothetical protein